MFIYMYVYIYIYIYIYTTHTTISFVELKEQSAENSEILVLDLAVFILGTRI
jgi:hypothetical protein